MTPADAALLAGAGFLAGAVNAVAGGGSLISFPALLAVGYATVPANVTNSIAVLPGYLGGSFGYRQELAGQRGRARRLGAVAALGAGVGAGLLLVLPPAVFDAIVPFLVLGACALLLVSPRVGSRVERVRGPMARDVLVFLAAVYGGYFGAGLGIALLAILELGLDDDLQRLNALKGLLSLVVGVAAGVVFATLGPVHWGAAGIMAVSSLAGGRVGAALAKRLPARALRTVVVVFGVAVAVKLLLD